VLLLLAFDMNSVDNKKNFWMNWCASNLVIGTSENEPVRLTPEQCSWMWDQRLVPQEYIAGQFYGEPAQLMMSQANTPQTEPTTKKEKQNGKAKSR